MNRSALRLLLLALVLCLHRPIFARSSGELLVFSARFYKPNNEGRITHYHLYAIDPANPRVRRQLTFGKSDDTQPQWLPNGRQMVFVRDWQNGKPPQVCRLDTATGRVLPLFTGTAGGSLTFVLSYGGKRATVTQEYYRPYSTEHNKADYLIETGTARTLRRSVPVECQAAPAAKPYPRYPWFTDEEVPLCPLDARRVVAVEGSDFNTIPPRSITIYGATGNVLTRRKLYYEPRTLQAARESLMLSQFDEVRRVPGRWDGFLLGTYKHKYQRGVQLWIQTRTGRTSVWSRCLEPRFAPGGKWFAAFHGLEFETVGTQRTDLPMTEGVQPLYIARTAAPRDLMPVAPGWMHTMGWDWRPRQEKERSRR